MNKIICPVPLNQRPLNEFNSIRNSWIISWPFLERIIFYRKLTFSWLIITPVCLTISYGSDYLKNNLFELIFISLTASIAFPISVHHTNQTLHIQCFQNLGVYICISNLAIA